ncbi:MAG: 6,7-dimethyl-8-ribityllumazine synthase, partial [Gemmatimonadetes bacterium]|nr:6,7-dimethyl-8-ribityllumazine synthase [Gemmatimonadota bacterium]
MKEHSGMLRGDGRRFGIVVGRFNELVTRQLLAGAHDCLVRHGVSDDDMEAVWVPGAWEIPGALRRLA